MVSSSASSSSSAAAAAAAASSCVFVFSCGVPGRCAEELANHIPCGESVPNHISVINPQANVAENLVEAVSYTHLTLPTNHRV